MARLLVEDFINSDIINRNVITEASEIYKLRDYPTNLLDYEAAPMASVMVGNMDVRPTTTIRNTSVSSNPVAVTPATIKTHSQPMAHQWFWSPLTENNVRMAQQKLDAYAAGLLGNGTYTDAELYMLVNKLFGMVFRQNLQQRANAEALMLGQLLTNPNGINVQNGVNEEAYTYTLPTYNTDTTTYAALAADPIGVLMDMIRDTSAADGYDVNEIWVGKNVGTAIRKAVQSMLTNVVVAPSRINYTPRTAGTAIDAKNASLVYDVGGIRIIEIDTTVPIDNVNVDTFDPDTAVGVNTNTLGKVYSAPIYKGLHKDTNSLGFVTELMSFDEDVRMEKNMKDTIFTSECFYLTTLNDSEYIHRATFTQE
jgi:hypothetical protein